MSNQMKHSLNGRVVKMVEWALKSYILSNQIILGQFYTAIFNNT
jgi:hypothetical protein